MARKRSLIDLCLTPKADVPGSLKFVISAAVWLGVIAVWSLLTYGGFMQDIFLPSPTAVTGAFFRLLGDGTLAEHIWASLQVVVIGFLISSIIAVPLGLLDGHVPGDPGRAGAAGELHPLSAGDLLRAAVHPVDRHRHRATHHRHLLRHLLPAAGR